MEGEGEGEEELRGRKGGGDWGEREDIYMMCVY